jgi:plasmid stabilization system protein ParE
LKTSDDADRDLDGIWDYIAEDNIDAADQWIGRLFDAFDAIANPPGIGHKREDLTVTQFWSGRWALTLSSIVPHRGP